MILPGAAQPRVFHTAINAWVHARTDIQNNIGQMSATVCTKRELPAQVKILGLSKVMRNSITDWFPAILETRIHVSCTPRLANRQDCPDNGARGCIVVHGAICVLRLLEDCLLQRILVYHQYANPNHTEVTCTNCLPLQLRLRSNSSG